MGLFTSNPDGGTVVAATGSSVAGTVTCPVGTNAMHIANTSATLHVSVEWGTAAVTAVLGTHLTLPPMGHIVVGIPPTITNVAAIGSAAGPTNVTFMPGIWGG